MTHIGSTIPVHIRTHGSVPPEATDYAVDKLDAALRHTADPVVDTWVTLDAAAPGDRVDAHVNISVRAGCLDDRRHYPLDLRSRLVARP